LIGGVDAFGFIVVIVSKEQVNLSCSVTIGNSDFSFRRNDRREALAGKSPFEGGRGMTNRNYEITILTITIAEIPLLGGAGWDKAPTIKL
jgi:hypothetical protein